MRDRRAFGQSVGARGIRTGEHLPFSVQFLKRSLGTALLQCHLLPRMRPGRGRGSMLHLVRSMLHAHRHVHAAFDGQACAFSSLGLLLCLKTRPVTIRQKSSIFEAALVHVEA